MSCREMAKVITEALEAEREAYLEMLRDEDYARIEDELCEYLSAE